MIQRVVFMLPFAALIATFGLQWLWQARCRLARPLAVALLVIGADGADAEDAVRINDGLDIGAGDAGSLLAVHMKNEQLRQLEQTGLWKTEDRTSGHGCG